MDTNTLSCETNIGIDNCDEFFKKYRGKGCNQSKITNGQKFFRVLLWIPPYVLFFLHISSLDQVV